MDSQSGFQDSEEDYFTPKYADNKRRKSKKIRPKTAKTPSVLVTPKHKSKRVDRLKAFLAQKQL